MQCWREPPIAQDLTRRHQSVSLDKGESIECRSRRRWTTNPMPEGVPISKLRTRQNVLLEKAAQQPILLTKHGRARAVLLGPESYNRLQEQVEGLLLALDGVEAREVAGPVTSFEKYLSARGEHVPGSSDQ